MTLKAKELAQTTEAHILNYSSTVGNIMSLLGVKYPCYGEFYCGDCKRRWDSCVAWRDYGQECKSCSVKLRPSKLEQLFPYCCTNPLCGKQWKNKRAEKSQCFECRSPGKMFLVMADRRKYISAKNLQPAGPSKNNHERKLCEYCQVSQTGDCRSSHGKVRLKKQNAPAEMTLRDVPEKIKQPRRTVKIQELPSPLQKLVEGQFSMARIPLTSAKVRPNYSYASALNGHSFSTANTTTESTGFGPPAELIPSLKFKDQEKQQQDDQMRTQEPKNEYSKYTEHSGFSLMGGNVSEGLIVTRRQCGNTSHANQGSQITAPRFRQPEEYGAASPVYRDRHRQDVVGHYFWAFVILVVMFFALVERNKNLQEQLNKPG